MWRYVLMLAVGLLGAALFAGGWHLWTDHNDLHALIQIESARQRALQKPPAEAPRAPER